MNTKMYLFVVLFVLLVYCTLINGNTFQRNLNQMKNSLVSRYEIMMKDLMERTKVDVEDSAVLEAVTMKETPQIKKEAVSSSRVSEAIILKNSRKEGVHVIHDSTILEAVTMKEISQRKKEAVSSMADPKPVTKANKIENEKKIDMEEAVNFTESQIGATFVIHDPKTMKQEKKIKSFPLITMQFKEFIPNLVLLLLPLLLIVMLILWSFKGKDSRPTLLQQHHRDIVYKSLSAIEAPFNVPSLVTSLDSALLILRLARTVDLRLSTSEINDFYEYLKEVEINSTLIRQGFDGLKVLSIEGLEGSGKSTLIEGLVAKTGAITMEYWKNTSAEVQQQFFNAEVPEVVATALAFVLNYCTAYQIITETGQIGTDKNADTNNFALNDQIIIIEQFHHSLCANTVASNIPADTDLRTLPTSVYEWPVDLPRPTLVVFLFLPCSERSLRIDNKTTSTMEINKIEKNKKNISKKLMNKNSAGYDDRIATVYSLITGPPTIVLDASTSSEEVLTIALEACEEFDIYTPPVIPRKRVNKRVSVGFYDGIARF